MNDEAVAIICLTILFILCYGSPDILDGLIKIINH